MATTFTVLDDDNVTWRDVSSYVLSAKFKDGGQNSLNVLQVSFKKDVNTVATWKPIYSREMRMTVDSVVKFGGRIDTPLSEFPNIGFIAFSYGNEFLDRIINEFYNNTTPEAMAADLIAKYTTLTWGSTWVSGFTIPSKKFKNVKLRDALAWLTQLTNALFSTDYQKKAYFEPQFAVDTGFTATVGSNVITKPDWSYNADFVVNQLTLEGDRQIFHKVEANVSAGAGQTSFALTYPPVGNMKVTDNGTMMVGGITGATANPDYTIATDGSAYNFGTGRTAGHTIACEYDYAVNINVTRGTGATPIKERYVKNLSIKSFDEARAYIRSYLGVHATASKQTKIPLYGFDSRLKSGANMTVVDPYEIPPGLTTSINESLMITGMEYSYPDNVLELEVGTNEYTIFNWYAEVMERIRESQTNDSTNSLIQKYDGKLTQSVMTHNTRTDAVKRKFGDSFIIAVSLTAVDNEGDRREGDVFTSYANSGVYVFGTVWTPDAGVTNLSNTKMQLAATAGVTKKATYNGWSGPAYTAKNGQIIANLEPATSGIMSIRFRKTASTTYYSIEIDRTGGTVKLCKTIAGARTVLVSASDTIGATYQVRVKYINSLFRVYNSAGRIIDTSDNSITLTGSVEVTASETTHYLDSILIYTGD